MKMTFDALPTVLLVLVSSVLLPTTDQAAAATLQVGSSSRFTEVDTFGSTAAWSRYEPGVGYRLTVRYGGATQTLKTKSRSVPFDADVGTDRHGHVVITYSRCKHEEEAQNRTSTGCSAFVYFLRSKKEVRLRLGSRPGRSTVLPAMWQGALAYATYKDPSRREEAVSHDVRVREAAGRVRSVRGGPSRGSNVADADGKVTSMDLRGRTVAFSWSYSNDCGPVDDDDLFLPFTSEVRTASVDTSDKALVRAICSTDGAVGVPTISPGGLTYTSIDKDRALRLSWRPSVGASSDLDLPPAAAAAAQYGTKIAFVQERGARFIIFVRSPD